MDMQNSSENLLTGGTPPAEQDLPWRRFVGTGAFAAAALPGLVWAISGVAWSTGTAFAFVFYAIAISLAGWAFRASYPHRPLGLCNIVTIGRLALTASLTGALFAENAAIPAVLTVACITFLLDGADGWLARRAQLTSDFGARFDVEVDSAFALILACLAMQGGLSPLVLLLGLPRYVFGAAQVFWPRLKGPLAERFSRKVVCVCQIAALIFLIVPTVDPSARHLVAIGAGALLVWSFAIDIRALLRVPE